MPYDATSNIHCTHIVCIYVYTKQAVSVKVTNVKHIPSEGTCKKATHSVGASESAQSRQLYDITYIFWIN